MAQLSKKTLALYARVLNPILDDRDYYMKRANLIKFFDSKTPSMQRLVLPALYAYARELHIDGAMLVKLKYRMKNRKIKKVSKPLTDEQMDKLLLLIESSNDLRQKICMYSLILTGVRRFELQMVISSYLENPQEKILLIEGKRGKQRKVYITNKLVELYEQGINLYGVTKMGKFFSPNYVYRLTKEYFGQIDYNGACHDLRRRFAQNLDNNGTRLSVVSKLMGHANISTTSIYINQTDQELSDVVEKQNFNNMRPFDNRSICNMVMRMERSQLKVSKQREEIDMLTHEVAKLKKENTKTRDQLRNERYRYNIMKERYKAIIKEMKKYNLELDIEKK